jgi:gliding motility-associated-like protein
MKSFYIRISSVIFALFISIQTFGSTGTFFYVVNGEDTIGTGAGTLRQAILDANGTSGSTIIFNYTGVITLTSALPVITSTVTVDGTSAPGYTSFPLVTVIGTSSINAGLQIIGNTASGSVVKGLHITDSTYSSVGIHVDGANNVSVIGCYLYTDFSSPNKDGFRSVDNAALGIRIENCTGEIIGGATPDSANVINCQLPLFFVSTSFGQARGNFLNTDKNGNTPPGSNPGSFNTGISLYTTSNFLIENNAIGYVYTAMNLSSSSGNTIRNNYMGTNAAGTSMVPNGIGIWFSNGFSNSNIITSNIIANCTSGGALYMYGTGDLNTISQNSFYCNAGGGGYSVAWNNYYSVPVFSSPTYALSGGTVSVSGTSNPNDLVEFFIADPCSGTEGKTYISYTSADAAGAWTTSLSFSSGVKITATNTNSGRTSGFAASANILDCSAVSANAGSDTSICTGNTFYLNGLIMNADSLIWTTSGSGIFSDSSAYNSSYTPSAADTAAGSVIIILTTLPGTCAAIAKDTMKLSFTPSRIANAGPNQNICLTGAGAQLNGTLFNATKGAWSGGYGTYLPNDSTPNARYIPNPPLDFGDGSYVILTFTPLGASISGCSNVSDDVQINFEIPETVIATLTGDSICKDSLQLIANLSKNVSSASWSSSLNKGTFYPSIAVPSGSPYNYYTPAAQDYAAGSVYLILTASVPQSPACSIVKDSALLTLIPTPTALAGSDIIVCANVTQIPLNGQVTNATTTTWSTSGTGVFSPNANVATATYIPSIADTSKIVKLVLTASTSCSSASDTLTIKFPQPPVSKAGSDIIACANVTSVPLSGQVANNTVTTWSTSGTGTFSPNANTVIASYIPSIADTSSVVFLTLTAAASCATVTDTLSIKFTQPPVSQAGADIIVCANVTNIPLNGQVTNAATTSWSTSGTGVFSPNANVATATYIPSIADTSKIVKLVLTAAASCSSARDTLTIKFPQPPVSKAGSDIIACANVTSVPLSGQVANNVATTWSTSGTGTFSPNANVAIASYIPSIADTSSVVFLTLTAASSCATVMDTLSIIFPQPPISQAGADIIVCANVTTIPLNGNVANASAITWNTSGTGVFSPNSHVAVATYIPSIADTSSIIRLTLTASSSCGSANDTLAISFLQAPVSQAGQDIITCQGNNFSLKGTVTNGAKSLWSSNGTGQFLPNDTTLNATYVPSKADIKRVAIGLTLTATLTGCGLTKDELLGVVLPPPDAGQGTKQQLCPDNNITLNALAPGPDQTGKWTLVSGSGVILSPGQPTTLINNISADENTYQWTITDTSTGCSNSTLYIVDHCFEPDITVYNVVSPNNDGMNEFLEIENIENYTKNKVIIYNRNGDLVFQMDDYDNVDKVFKGKSNVGISRDLQDGVYYYLISKGNGGKPQKGFLVLRNDK